jgi:hypothetical protein
LEVEQSGWVVTQARCVATSPSASLWNAFRTAKQGDNPLQATVPTKQMSADAVDLPLDVAREKKVNACPMATFLALVVAGIVAYIVLKERRLAAERSEFAPNANRKTTPAQDCALCKQKAIRDGAHVPQGLVEGGLANGLSNQGKSWADTDVAKGREKAGMIECLRAKGYTAAEIETMCG